MRLHCHCHPLPPPYPELSGRGCSTRGSELSIQYGAHTSINILSIIYINRALSILCSIFMYLQLYLRWKGNVGCGSSLGRDRVVSLTVDAASCMRYTKGSSIWEQPATWRNSNIFQKSLRCMLSSGGICHKRPPFTHHFPAHHPPLKHLHISHPFQQCILKKLHFYWMPYHPLTASVSEHQCKQALSYRCLAWSAWQTQYINRNYVLLIVLTLAPASAICIHTCQPREGRSLDRLTKIPGF